MLETLVAAVMLAALILYALTGGADFGGGMWDLWAFGPRAERQRAVIAHAIGPIWEANHVWLILVIVLLFTGFPAGFAAVMTALHVPLLAMLLGIVLRGSAFVFRKYDAPRGRARWGWVFGVASCFTPFVQGVCLGGLATGRIQVAGFAVTSGFFSGWTTLFAASCGVFALVLFAFLAAVYLTVDSAADRAVQEDFRRRALAAAAVLGPVALGVFLSSRHGAPEMYRGLTDWWAPVLLAWTSIFALAAVAALAWRRFALARAAAVAQVSLILVGWCLAQYPCLIVGDVTIAATAAPASTLRLLLIALGSGAILLFPSLFYLYYVFKRAGAVGRPHEEE